MLPIVGWDVVTSFIPIRSLAKLGIGLAAILLSPRVLGGLMVFALAAVSLPDLAHAASAAGGGMPYSSFLGTFKTSITGEIAAIICVIAIIAGVATYIFASAFDGILLTIARIAIGATIIGSAVTTLTTMGVSGAIV
ncbi:MAG: TrbC/VirB2 family protein [Rhodopila sp.]